MKFRFKFWRGSRRVALGPSWLGRRIEVRWMLHPAYRDSGIILTSVKRGREHAWLKATSPSSARCLAEAMEASAQIVRALADEWESERIYATIPKDDGGGERPRGPGGL